MQHIEVEYKYKVQNKDVLQEKIQNIGAKMISEGIFQKDIYYTPAHKEFYESEPMPQWLRLRESSQGFFITYKNFHVVDGRHMNYCDEYESKIDDLEQMKLLFNALEISERMVVEKTRDKYIFEHAEIVVDDVVGIGTYCEIEIKGAFSTPGRYPKICTPSLDSFSLLHSVFQQKI